MQSAEAHGISLIINFVNNWVSFAIPLPKKESKKKRDLLIGQQTDYGGMQAYATYYDIALTDWYTSAAAQAQYQKYIAAVVSRYKTSTAIFAWELANEPRCSGCDVSVINTWATTTSAYIKSLDSNHMVTMGDEGFGLDTLSDGSYPFTTAAGGYNWTQNLQIPDIDFGTYHLYPSSWGEADTWGPLWIQAHAEAANAIGKPVIMEEYGSLTLTDEEPWQAEVLATETAGDMYWQYGDDLSTGETANDGYAIYYGTATYTTLVSLSASYGPWSRSNERLGRGPRCRHECKGGLMRLDLDLRAECSLLCTSFNLVTHVVLPAHNFHSLYTFNIICLYQTLSVTINARSGTDM